MRRIAMLVSLALVMAGCGSGADGRQQPVAAPAGAGGDGSAAGAAGQGASGDGAAASLPGSSSRSGAPAAPGVPAGGSAPAAATRSGAPTTPSPNGHPSAAPTGRSAAAPAPGTAGAAPPAGTPAPSSEPGRAPRTGGQAPPASGATPAAPSTPIAGGRSEIRLGSIGVGSGPIGAAMRSFVDGAKAWSAAVNERGGLAGHPVRVIFVDDGGDPRSALGLAKRLVEEDKVQAFYATHAPTTEEAYTAYVEQKQVPIIGTCGCSNVVDQSPMIFHVGPGSPGGASWAHVLQFTALTDKRNVALLYCREVAVCPLLADGVKKAAKPAGFTVVYEAQISLAQPDYTAEMLSARNAKADVVVAISDNATGIRVARSAHRQDYRPVFAIQQSANEDSFLKSGKEDIEGAVVSAVVPDYATSPKLADFREAMDRFVPGGRRGSFAAQTWAAGKLLEAIAPGFGADVTSADILAGLYRLRGETLGGLVPPMTFAAGRGHGDVNQCIVPSRVENGRFVYPFGERFFCPPGFKPFGS